MIHAISNFSTLADRYDAFLLDVWGVIHDGSHLYPGVHETLTQLRARGKKIIFISNAPRRAHKVEAVLNKLGIEKTLYDMVMTSGEAGFQWLAAGKASWEKRYFYIGPDKDLDVLDGLDYVMEPDIAQSNFILNVGFGSENDSNEDWSPVLEAASAKHLPMLCLNPDLEVVKQNGARFGCAGVVAEAYVKRGGYVVWFGKPYPEVYEYCFRTLEGMDKKRILAVGDGLHTDIAGALNTTIDAALISGGLLVGKSADDIEALCRKQGTVPHYVAPAFRW